MTRDEINKLVLPFLLKIFDKERVKTSSLCKVCVGAKGEYGGHTYTDDRFGSHRDWYNCSNCNGTGYELREGTIQDVIEDVDLYEQLLAALTSTKQPEDLHGKIMNIPVDIPKMIKLFSNLPTHEASVSARAYKLGCRDTRHAAAELVTGHWRKVDKDGN